MVRFGPAGNSEKFYELKYKSSLEMPKWLNELGLSAYEYQCSKGVKISDEAGKKLGREAEKYNIALSIHSPYYISLSTNDDEKREKTINYILQTLNAANCMGASRIVVHSGALMKNTRKQALEYAKENLKLAICRGDEMGFSHIHICPESMGKINQLGTIEEVMELCKLDERLIPTIDFGHENARTLGALKTKEDFLYIFDQIENKLGIERLKNFHSHYSRIEYTNGGEKMHHTFDDIQYGPDFHPIAQILAEKKLSPVIICESRGTQTEDAVKMQEIYNSYMK